MPSSYTKPSLRIGFGYDIHRLISGRPLVIGGQTIPYPYGLDGHSDADVLIHAICDALLGAAGLRDIGVHFPDTDPKYTGADSTLLLVEVVRLLYSKGYRVGNIDATVVAERPKLNRYIPAMTVTLAGILLVEEAEVSIKATTNEGLGPTGRGEGIAAYCSALIYKDESIDLTTENTNVLI